MEYTKIKRDSEIIEMEGIRFRVPLSYNMIAGIECGSFNRRVINVAIFDGNCISTRSFDELVSPYIQMLVDSGLDIYLMQKIDESDRKWDRFSKFELDLTIKDKTISLKMMRGSDESYAVPKLYWDFDDSDITEEGWALWGPMIVEFAKKIVATIEK